MKKKQPPASPKSFFDRALDWAGSLFKTTPGIARVDEVAPVISKPKKSKTVAAVEPVPAAPDVKPVVLLSKTPDLGAKIEELAGLLRNPERHKPVLVIYAPEQETDAKNGSLRLAKRSAKAAGDEAQVYYCDRHASRMLAQGMKSDEIIGAAQFFRPDAARTGAITIDHGALGKVSKMAAAQFLDTLKRGVEIFLADNQASLKDHTQNSGAPAIHTSVLLREQFTEKPKPCKIFVTPEVKKILESPGQSKGLPLQVHKAFISKLNNPEGKFEPKGRRFSGIDITPSGSNYRAIFTLNQQQEIVLFFVGGHDDYNKISDRLRHYNDSEWHRIIDDEQLERFEIPSVSTTHDRLFKAITGHALSTELKPHCPGQPSF